MSKNKLDYLGIGLIAGAAVGAIAGFTSYSWYQKHKFLKADTILEEVKNAFLAEGPIEGSWIHLTKEPLQKFAIKTQTYTGGVTRLEDSALVQYEFIADAKTGTIIDIYRL